MVEEIISLLFDIKSKGGNTIGQQAGTAATGVNKLGTASTTATKAGTAQNAQLLQTGNQLNQVTTKGAKTTGVFNSMKTSVSGMGTKMLGAGLGIAGVASGIAAISDSYDNLKDTELALHAERLKGQKISNSVRTAELALKTMRDKGEAGTEKYRIAEAKLKTLKEKQGLATEQLANSEDDYQRAQRSFYLQIVPQIIGIGTQLAASIMLIKTGSGGAAAGMEGMSKASRLLGTALKTIPLIAIAAAILAIRTNAFGFRDALDSIGKKIGDILPGLRPLLQWVRDFAAALGLTGGKMDWGKAFDMLKKGFQSAIDTILNTDWSKVLGDMFKKISDWFAHADWKKLWEIFKFNLWEKGTWIANMLVLIFRDIKAWISNPTNQKAVWDGFYNAITATYDWISTNMTKIRTEIIKWWTKNGAGVWQGFYDAFVSSVTWIGQGLVKVAGAIFDWFLKNGPSVVSSIASGIGAAFLSTAAWVAKVADPFIAGFLGQAQIALTSSLPQFIKDTFTVENLVKGVNLVAGAINYFVATIFKTMTPQAVTGAGNFATNIVTEIGKWFAANLPKTTQAFIKLVVAVSTSALVAASEFVKWFTTQLPVEIVKGGEKLVAAAKNIGIKILEGIKNGVMTGNVKGLTGTGLEGVWNAIVGFFAGHGVEAGTGTDKPITIPGNGVVGGVQQTTIPAPDTHLFINEINLLTTKFVIPFQTHVNTLKMTLPAPLPGNFTALIANISDIYNKFVSLVNLAKTTIPGPLPDKFNASISSVSATYNKFVQLINLVKLTIPAASPSKFNPSIASASQTFNKFVTLVNQVKITIPKAILTNFNKSMDDAVSKAKSAASAIEKALNGIKVNPVYVGLTGPGASKATDKSLISNGAVNNNAPLPSNNNNGSSARLSVPIIFQISGNELFPAATIMRNIEIQLGKNIRTQV